MDKEWKMGYLVSEYVLDICHFVVADVVTRLFEHILGFGKCYSDGSFPFSRDLEVASFRVAFFLEDVGEGLVLLAFLELADHEGDEVLAEVENFVVVVYDWHFKVESGELVFELAL